mmetsp:Transcript_4578/g.6604  ORF Transcript_4578/g.6604 Transcript_4578/m.6604 type:complete len:81 (-) Transcript_4578:1073-1315(-)
MKVARAPLTVAAVRDSRDIWESWGEGKSSLGRQEVSHKFDRSVNVFSGVRTFVKVKDDGDYFAGARKVTNLGNTIIFRDV